MGWHPAQTAGTPYPAPFSQISPEEETTMIRSQIEMMEQDIKAARERLGELESKQD
jgi:hypothetical protein